ncbi:hypothetical protein C1645_783576 [Glomus cerebriforme]|uniref:HMG box domain-containing protein n=1 Tax=Glomus cerebriforme TaxID=658196 RepID=A0A397SEP0_9GLOM|nr:hypothetical protein C1645_783576 [Glomus cerebriforme]
MDETVNNSLILEIPQNNSKDLIMIDCTKYFKNISIKTQENFAFTAFVEPMTPTSMLSFISSKISPCKETVNYLNNNESNRQLVKKPSQPPNAFILYRQAKQKQINKDKKIPNPLFSQIIAKMWKNESEGEKLHWERIADKNKLEYVQQIHRDYVYQKPIRKIKRKYKRKTQQNILKAPLPGLPKLPELTTSNVESVSPFLPVSSNPYNFPQTVTFVQPSNFNTEGDFNFFNFFEQNQHSYFFIEPHLII